LFLNAYTLAPLLGSFWTELLLYLLYIGFFLSSILLIVIILLQEGKGGGFAGAFGGVGTEAFGVKAGGINKLTGFLAILFVICALILGIMTKSEGTVAKEDLEPPPPTSQRGMAPGTVPAPGPGEQPPMPAPAPRGGQAPGAGEKPKPEAPPPEKKEPEKKDPAPTPAPGKGKKPPPVQPVPRKSGG